jgi:hypothetical protein
MDLESTTHLIHEFCHAGVVFNQLRKSKNARLHVSSGAREGCSPSSIGAPSQTVETNRSLLFVSHCESASSV